MLHEQTGDNKNLLISFKKRLLPTQKFFRPNSLSLPFDNIDACCGTALLKKMLKAAMSDTFLFLQSHSDMG